MPAAMPAHRSIADVPAIRSEDQLQAAVVRWARAHDDARLHTLFHIPNGGQRTGRAGGTMVALGARAGVPDLFLPVPVVSNATAGMARWAHGLWLELKHGAGDTTPAQDRWLRTLAAQGYAVAIAWSVGEAQTILLDYLSGRHAPHTTAALEHVGPGPGVA